MENITETSVKELLYDKLIFRLEISNTYWIKLEPIEGSLAKIEEIIARNIKRLKSLNLEENESRPFNEWIYIENTIKAISDRISLVVDQYKEYNKENLVPEKDILVQLVNGTASIVEESGKYFTTLFVSSYCDLDQSYEMIIEFIEWFREKYKNDSNFEIAINNFITINKDTNCVGYYFSRSNYYESLPALFWIEKFVKSINLDTSSVDRNLKKLEGFIKSEHNEASKIQKNSKKF